jgi:hypothetical protein
MTVPYSVRCLVARAAGGELPEDRRPTYIDAERS